MMPNNKQYIGKTNRELILEVIGKVSNIEEKLSECRPTCFGNQDNIIKIKQDQKNLKFVVTAAASIVTLIINGIFWIFKKTKGG